MKKRWKTLFLLVMVTFLCVTMCPLPPVWAKSDREPVRVAYFDLGDYYQVNEDSGVVESYDTAYLSMISEYTGLEFEYVDCKTWDQALAMLRAHEIDLVGTMQWTKEREEEYAICDANYGYAVSELASLPDRDFVYEDYEKIEGTKIGCMEGYVIYDHLQKLLRRHNISADVITYTTQTELDRALENGDIDLVAANSHAMHDDWKIIEKFAYAPFYFASWGGNDELTDAISDAIIQINVYQSGFDDGLISEYFPFLVNSPYNKEDFNLMDQGKTYTVYFDDMTKPLAWYDEETDSMQGILPDIMEEVGEKSGIQFNIRPLFEKQSGEQDCGKYYTMFSNVDRLYVNGTNRSEPILNEDFYLYHKGSQIYNPESDITYRVAVPQNRVGSKEYIEEYYPEYEIIEYDTPQECIESLLLGKADLTFLSNYVANEILVSQDIDNILAIPTTVSKVHIGVQFYGDDATILSDIVDKAYKLIDTEDINKIKLNNVTNTSPNITLAYIIKNHPVESVAVFCTFLFLLVALFLLFVYSGVIKKKNQMILDANRSKEEFYARMSHDMRTPMNGILGMAELSKDEMDVQVLHHNMERVEESGTYLLNLINDVLDMNKIESGKIGFHEECIDVEQFFQSIVDMMAPLLKEKEVILHTDFSSRKNPYVYCDKMRMKQIYVNLLSNAIKFSKPGGTVDWIVRDTGEKDNCQYFEQVIRDYGCGMSEEFLKKIFTPFAQEMNPYSKEYPNTGLGLAITKNLVTLMGGTISVKSKLGEGSEFTICLHHRISQKPPGEEEKNQKSYSELYGLRVLLAEDHPLNVEIAKKLLEKQNMKVTVAMDGIQAISLFQESEEDYFHAILMDIRMPNVDGLEATRRIRALERRDAKTVPIIAMTANAYSSDKEACYAADMNAHISKPIEPEVLYQTIQEQIRIHKI